MCCQSQELKEGGREPSRLQMYEMGSGGRLGLVRAGGPGKDSRNFLEFGVISSGEGYLPSVFSFLIPHLVSQSAV